MITYNKKSGKLQSYY